MHPQTLPPARPSSLLPLARLTHIGGYSRRVASRLALATVLVLSTAGCASSRFKVEAISQSGAPLPRYSYRLVDARPPSMAPGPDFARVSHDVHAALSSRGLFPATDGTPAELLVEVDYGISAPIVTTDVVLEPVYVAVQSPLGFGDRRGSDFSSTAPQIRYLGNREVPCTVVSYRKFLRLTARTVPQEADGAPTRQVWSVVVTNEDGSSDLQRYARLMVAAAMDHIGIDQPEERTVVLNPKDRRVAFVARGFESS